MPNTTHSFIYLLKHTELAVRRCVEVVLEKFDLTPNQFLMLLRVSYEEGLSATQLARAIGVRPQSLTEIIGPLVEKGLVSRNESPAHRRVLQMGLTASGRELLDRALRVGHQLEDDLLADLASAERRALQLTLERVLARARWHECHPEVRRVATRALLKGDRLREGLPAVRRSGRRRTRS